MQNTLGFLGQIVEDRYLSSAFLVNVGPPAVIGYKDRFWNLAASGSAIPGAKVVVENLPDDLLSLCVSRLGGGSYNSCKTAGQIAPDLRLVLLDASDSDGIPVPCPNAQVCGLAMRRLPINLVVGARADKVILKSPIRPFDTLSAGQMHAADCLEGCQAVLVNSPKDTALVRYALEVRRRAGFSLATVITPSLDLPTLCDLVLPTSDLMIAGWDELSAMIGLGQPASMAQAVDALEWMRGQSPSAVSLVTLGRHGALATGAGAEISHICLTPEVSAQVQALVASSPVNCCGAGDAFAAGAFVQHTAGRTVLDQDGLQRFSAPVRAALSGCAAAVGWLGYTPPLTVDHFQIGSVSRFGTPSCQAICQVPCGSVTKERAGRRADLPA